MSVEKQVVTNQTVGYRWHISIERELRTESGAKYPDKTVLHATLEGNEDSYDKAKESLTSARKFLEEATKEAKP